MGEGAREGVSECVCVCVFSFLDGCGGQNRFGIPLWGFCAPPILEPSLVRIGMFTGGTIWILTHGHASFTARELVSAGDARDTVDFANTLARSHLAAPRAKRSSGSSTFR